jgi:hypothetical protein
VVVTGETPRLISGLFVVADQGRHTLKGMERVIALYRIVRPSGMRGRLAVAAATGTLTPFVGREEELRLLLNRWERVREGEGQVVTIIGRSRHRQVAAGTGISRANRRRAAHLARSLDRGLLSEYALLCDRRDAAAEFPLAQQPEQ